MKNDLLVHWGFCVATGLVFYWVGWKHSEFKHYGRFEVETVPMEFPPDWKKQEAKSIWPLINKCRGVGVFTEKSNKLNNCFCLSGCGE